MAKNKTTFKDFNSAFAPHKAAKEAEYKAKYDNGEPVEIEIPVELGFSHAAGEMKVEKRKFTIDNTLAIRRKLNGLVLQDLSKIERDATQRTEKASYAIKKSNIHPTGSIPEFLHDLPKGTKKKSGKDPQDLTREAYQ